MKFALLIFAIVNGQPAVLTPNEPILDSRTACQKAAVKVSRILADDPTVDAVYTRCTRSQQI